MAGGYFHEVRQQANIGQAKADAQNAQRTAEGAQEVLRKLEKKVNSLTILTQVLWSLVKEKEGLTEADLMARFQQLAASTGAQVQECGQCARPVGKAQTKCMYCGTEKTVGSIFDTL